MLGIGSTVFPPGGFNLDVDVEDSDTSETAPGTPWADDPSVEMRIREIEERLDGLMASNPHEDLDHAPPSDHIAVAPASADTAVDAAREVLESDYYRKKWGRTSLRDLTSEIDDFGMDPAFEQKLRPALDFMFKRYFRVEVEGVRNVPTQGRAVVVANHSGALPFDGVMLREAIRQRHPGRDDLRWLAEDFSFYLPFLGVTLNRLGAVRACPENAERLLGKGHLVGVFPEGAEGIKKLYRDRYRLQRFGRGGFVRLCLKTQSPIVPCAIIGAEETNPILYRFDNLSKLLGLDYLPITPTFPLLGPLGLLPAPTKWRIVFGEPISVEEYGPQAAQDHVLVGRLAERVRSSINDLLETALRRRKSIWL
jgi:1-acyl-sn-glycerol-3-phosphate acyltransferase